MGKKQVVIIGAGMGGLTAAVKLAVQGLNVTLVERGTHCGGKLREQHSGERSYYTGPTVLTMPWVFEKIFAEAGAAFSDQVVLHSAVVLARHAWGPDQRLDLYTDHERSAQAIGEFAGAAEAAGFLRFARHAKRVFRALEGPFMLSSRPTPISIFGRFGVSDLGELMQIKALTSLWNALGGFFKDERLRQLFGRYATYVGSSPYLSPATLMLIADVESRGVHAIEGGIHRLPEALAVLGAQHGVTFRYSEPAAEIVVRGGRAAGVRLASGEQLDADVVVFNGDAAAIGAGLMGQQVRRAIPPVAAGKRSHSVVTWNLVAKPQGFPLEYHNVFFPPDYAQEFHAVFDELRLPSDPTVYICAQDRGNPDAAAPQDPERLLLVVNAPARGDTQTIADSDIRRCEARVFRLLEHCGLTLEQTCEPVITTPAHFERSYPASGGAVFGRASHGWRASFDRPGAKTRIPGLYLTGGTVHPGAGIPMAAISGGIAAATVLADLAGG